MKAKAYKIICRWFGSKPNAKQVGKWANNLRMCSCMGCGNQRKYLGPTKQEKLTTGE